MEIDIKQLQEKSQHMRELIVKMVGAAGSGHPGGSLSIVEMMTVLYFGAMRVRPDEPNWPERDRFVLSKGHAAPALYSALAMKGYFPEDELMTLRKLGSRLQGHPDMKKLPGIDMSTGSLGQGLSAANGMALGLRVQGVPANVYAIVGDGETEEGQIWEAAMTAAHYRLEKLIVFQDLNLLQIDGTVDQVKGLTPLPEKWKAFNWHVQEIDGHDLQAIANAIETAKLVTGRPHMIVAHTVKGKGVDFMENQVGWHGKAPSKDEIAKALAQLAGGDK
jgi:transketolase